MRIKELIYSIMSNNFRWLNYSFSQEGEDIILSNMLEKNDVFYVDVGSFHPFRFSNTMYFYSRGARGINIDATPGSMKLFKKWRRRDINVEAAITDSKGESLNYYIYKEGALNTFDVSRTEYLKTCGYEYYTVKQIKTYTINEILDKYLPDGQSIDFLDIDIEGFDEKVLQSLDFNKYRPKYILTESFDANSPVKELLEANGYLLKSFTGRTAIYGLNG